MQRIIQALRARRLDGVAIGYAVVGWVLVQAADIILPTFDAPDWALRALIIFLLIGFPFALAIAWFAVPRIAAPGPGTNPARTYILLGAFVVVIALVAGDFAYLLSNMASVPQRPAAESGAAPAKNSIAVLPFANMSGDPAKDYFSDGISEELLNDLANIPALRVAARTSSFAFKGKNENIAHIARVLAVHSILEGSVRANGAHLRITATLIDAAHGYTLWSKTYDRNLTDVLIVQSEIAQAITAALTHKLLPAADRPKPAKPHTIDPEAYRTYLRGKHELAPRTQAGAEAALILFRKVTQLAPDFAEGFAALARAQINVAEYDLERRDLIQGAHKALARALMLDPRNIDALSSHLDLSLHELAWQAAIDDARQMQAINPHSAAVLHEMFRFYQFLGFPDEALDAARGAVKLDPLSFVDHLNAVAGLLHNGRYADVQEAGQAALDLSPDQPYLLSMLCSAAAHRADFDAARAAKVKLAAAGAGISLRFCEFQIAAAQGRKAEAKAIMDRLAKTFSHGGPSATELGENYAIIGENALAVRWLTRAYDQKEYLLFLFSGEKVVPKAFFRDAGWKALYKRPLFDAWRKAHARVAAELVETK
jgi:TolB-like protein